MPDRLIRTFAASSILVALAIGGSVQLLADSDEPPAELVETAVDSDNAAFDDPTSTTTTGPDASVDETAEPFVYKIGLLQGVSTRNFWKYFGSAPTVWDAYVLAPTKASLYRLDPATQEIVPEIADSVASPVWNHDGWHVRVTLRDDMRWSDGIRLTASDVSFTFRTVRALGLGGQWGDVFPASVTSVKALDEVTVEIGFAARPSLSTWPYGAGTAPIMASHVWGPQVTGGVTALDLFALDGESDVAGGPIELVQVEESRIVAHANPGYHNNNAAPVVEFVVFGSEAELVAGLVDGRVHIAASPNGLQPAQVAHLAAVPGVEMVKNPKFGVRYLGFNTKREPMSNVAFRRATAFLVDREGLAAGVAEAPLANTMLPASAAAWYDVDAADAIATSRAPEAETDWAAILGALKESGYAWTAEPALVDGQIVAGTGLMIQGRVPATLTILTSGDSYDPERPEYASQVATAIELLGFKVIPVTTDFASVIDLTFSPDEEGKVHYDMALLGWSLGNPGLPGFYGDLFGSSGVANNTGYSSDAMDHLVGLLDAAPDIASARDAIWKMEALLAQDLPYLPLYASQITEAYRADLVGFPGQPLLGGIQAALAGIELVTSED